MSNIPAWCSFTTDQWSALTVDQWAEMPVCDSGPPPDSELFLYDGLKPITIAANSISRALMRDVSLDYSAPASDQTSNSVALDSGSFVWSQELLSMPSIGSFRWAFGLNYQQDSGISDILGPNFNFPQLSRLEFGYQQYRQEVVADRPLAYWKLDDTAASVAKDEMAYLSATYPAGTSLAQTGAIADGGTAAQFNDGDPFTVSTAAIGAATGSANPLNFNPQLHEFSVELWFKLPPETQTAFLFAKGDNSSSQYLVQIGVTDTTYTLTANVGGTTLTTTGSVDDDYHHLVLVNHRFANSGSPVLRFNLYVDGVPVASGDPNDLVTPDTVGSAWAAAGSTSNSNALTFAAGTNSGSATTGSFTGWLDELAVYDYALPSWRISAHAMVGKLGAIAASTTNPPIRLVSSQYTTTVFIWTALNGGQYADPTARSSTTLTPISDPITGYQLLSPDGTNTIFYASSAAAPGRMMSVSDRYGNMQSYTWDSVLSGKLIRPTAVTDPYNRVIHYNYFGSEAGYQLQSIADFAGRTTWFQYDASNRLAAVTLPAVTGGADDNGNTFPAGRAYVFAYDDSSSAKTGFLNRIWYPNQTLSYLTAGSPPSLDVAAVISSVDPRYLVTYGDGSSPDVPPKKVASERVGSADGSVGGTFKYKYETFNPPMANSFDAFDPIKFRTSVNDPNSTAAGITDWTEVRSYNRNRQPVRIDINTTRNKSSASTVSTFTTTMQFNAQNQLVKTLYPNANSTSHQYESGQLPQTTVGGQSLSPVLCVQRRGLPVKETYSAAGGTLADLVHWSIYDPLYNSLFASTDFRGQPTQSHLDYQQGSQTASALSSIASSLYPGSGYEDSVFELAVSQVGSLLADAGIASEFAFDLGTLNGFAAVTTLVGNALMTLLPPVDGTARNQALTYNQWGQPTTHTDAVGTITVFQYYLDSDPTGNTSGATGNPRGYLSSTIVDADPANVPSLSGQSGTFTSLITRPTQPFLALTTSSKYDVLGNVTQTTDAKGRVSTVNRNELGQVYRTMAPDPYSFRTETFYDANGNVTRGDIEDQVVDVTDGSPFVPSDVTDTSANGPMKIGDGGSVRDGWFTTTFAYDVLDRVTSQSVDCEYATGYSGSAWASSRGLTTLHSYDPNGNLTKLIKPMGNTVELDYDERNLQIVQRVGGSGGAVTVSTYDSNGKLANVIGPYDQDRQSGTNFGVVTIANAFGSGTSSPFNGDWTTANIYDGHQRLVKTIDALGNNMTVDSYDADGRILQQSHFGPASGASVTTRSVSGNQLAQANFVFDAAGRKTSETQKALGSDGTDLTTTYQYDAADRVVKAIQPNGGYATYSFDSIGRVVEVIDPVANTVQNVYDAVGNLVTTTRTEQSDLPNMRSEQFVTKYRYDVLNRVVITSQQGADGILSLELSGNQTLHTLSGYDSRGNRTVTIDPASNVSTQTFDEASRLVGTTQYPTSATPMLTSRKLDANDRLIGLQDANMNSTQFTFDQLDRPLQMIYPAVGDTSATSGWDYTEHDAATGPLYYTDCNGSIYAYDLDGIGRRIQLTVTGTDTNPVPVTQSWQYDGLSRMTAAFDQDAVTAGGGNGTVSVSYDSLGRKTSETNASGLAVTLSNFDDLVPRQMSFPNGRLITWDYDLLYRPESTTEQSTGKAIVQWDYIGTGRLLDATFGNGMQCLYRNNEATQSAMQSGDPDPTWGDASTDRIGYDGSGRLIAKRFTGTSSGGLGQYQYMTHQAVTQNQHGWNYALAEPMAGAGATANPTMGCCTPTGQYQFQTDQYLTQQQVGWDTVPTAAVAPTGTAGSTPPEEGMVRQMVAPDQAGTDSIRAHSM